MIAIITSARDVAGVAIRQQLLKDYGFVELPEKFDGFPVFTLPIEEQEARLYTTATDSINCEDIDKRIPADIFVFATRHVSKAGVPALTTHSIGNWGKADFGGRDGIICPTSPNLLKLFLQNLAAVAKSGDYSGEVVQESTHHGPFIEKPTVFIEVGSSESEWKDEKLASMVADSLIGGLGDFVALENDFTPVVGLGGMHYAESFRKLMLETDYAVGHICPKHHLQSLTKELLQHAMKACGAKSVALDWKGLGKEKEKVVKLLKSEGISYFKG
ncbi:D-aminoacyl-tRNA deacylase [Candidatus Woesearchaeota archaeon]|nr:D-aminoacyl-tRNA deacylase [Candidatus Woesearchaeota archaeon]